MVNDYVLLNTGFDCLRIFHSAIYPQRVNELQV